MPSFTREKINMLSSALLSELAMLDEETMEFYEYFCEEPSSRYGNKARAKVLSVLPEEAKDSFSIGYICGFVGRFVQLEEEKQGLPQNATLPKTLISQIMTDIFGKMRGPSLAKKSIPLSLSKNADFVKGYFKGGNDFDTFINFLAKKKPGTYPRSWFEYLKKAKQN